MSYMGKKALELAEGIRGIVKKYDPEGKLGMSQAIDEYITHWAWKTASDLEVKLEEDRK